MVRFKIDLPLGQRLVTNRPALALSADGSLLAYAATGEKAKAESAMARLLYVTADAEPGIPDSDFYSSGSSSDSSVASTFSIRLRMSSRSVRCC